MSRTWNLEPSERVNSLIAAIPYVAACPSCGGDAKWRDVLVSISGPHSGTRTAVQPEIECGVCGPIEGVVIDDD